jgi:hypothetical protein
MPLAVASICAMPAGFPKMMCAAEQTPATNMRRSRRDSILKLDSGGRAVPAKSESPIPYSVPTLLSSEPVLTIKELADRLKLKPSYG